MVILQLALDPLPSMSTVKSAFTAQRLPQRTRVPGPALHHLCFFCTPDGSCSVLRNLWMMCLQTGTLMSGLSTGTLKHYPRALGHRWLLHVTLGTQLSLHASCTMGAKHTHDTARHAPPGQPCPPTTQHAMHSSSSTYRVHPSSQPD